MKISSALLSNVFFMLTLIISAFAQASEYWSHRNLLSKEGVSIDVDYQYSPQCIKFQEGGRSDNEIRLADPVWINVTSKNSTDKVTVEIEFWQQSYLQYGSNTPSLQRTFKHYDRSLKLSHVADSKYTGEVGSLAIRHSIGSAHESWNIGQKIRVKINGHALIDPISGTDQFLIFLDDQKACLE